ncbi:MAG: hypothetical protein J6C62_09785 [Clostridia bacterium]|nr:hypothetical protein [Clostridia bacterium]
MLTKKSYEDVQVITPGQTYTEKVDVQLDKRYNYKLRLRGVGIPYTHRTETDYPIYFRKIEDHFCRLETHTRLNLTTIICAMSVRFTQELPTILKQAFRTNLP